MTAELCNEVYARPGNQGMLKCQYIKDHPADRHSWFAIFHQDETDLLAEAQRYHAPEDEKQLLERIEFGLYDSILEAILNAGHNRKRALRGVRGFPTLERRSNGRKS